ncbi:MAG: BlaI/MecI/CopY family transcriptional regulator [Acidobacteriales bacterium]|nr:BlaI/MecI/CopY family transcriptional regulator [Terriglobales bacterium]
MELGRLEREVMEFVWSRGEVTVRDFYEHTGGRLAYTTAMTTLDRLFKKNLLLRRKDGKAFLYSPQHTRAEFERGFARQFLDRMFARGGEETRPLLACLVEAVSQHDRRLLDELEEIVKKARAADLAGKR